MPRQLDQLPADTTSMARRLAALEREVREMRAARRMTAASVGTLRVYADDGTTLLAELGPEAGADGGGGLWTRGLQDPINMSAYLSSGELQFRPVENGQVAVPAGITYDSDAFQYTDLILTSGNVASTAHRAVVTLESTFEGGNPYVYVQGENSTQCNVDILGVLTSANLAWGSVTITPSAANTPTSATVSGLSLKGSTFIGFSGAQTAAPGSTTLTNGVTGTSATSVTSSGLTVWLTRQNTSATTVNWLVIGI
ncbi:hypothetical protein [Streptomyces sp. NBC_01530]|uniref:hypothetical protein n=1 Tax=Streptomyces sp. NBC_01530 TaxID=2903895 RepID=UPI00386EA28B